MEEKKKYKYFQSSIQMGNSQRNLSDEEEVRHDQRLSCNRLKKTKHPKCEDQPHCKWKPPSNGERGKCVSKGSDDMEEDSEEESEEDSEEEFEEDSEEEFEEDSEEMDLENLIYVNIPILPISRLGFQVGSSKIQLNNQTYDMIRTKKKIQLGGAATRFHEFMNKTPVYFPRSISIGKYNVKEQVFGHGGKVSGLTITTPNDHYRFEYSLFTTSNKYTATNDAYDKQYIIEATSAENTEFNVTFLDGDDSDTNSGVKIGFFSLPPLRDLHVTKSIDPTFQIQVSLNREEHLLLMCMFAIAGFIYSKDFNPRITR